MPSSKRHGTGSVMPTFAAQLDKARQLRAKEIREQFLGPPPSNEPLEWATLVLSEELTCLPDLEDMAFFDAIRNAHEVWIERDPTAVLRISSRTLLNLREGLRAVKDKINKCDMARKTSSTLFMVQMLNVEFDLVTVDLNCRPTAQGEAKGAQLIEIGTTSGDIADDLLRQIKPDFDFHMDVLRGKRETLQMRLDFGRVIIQRRKTSIMTGNQMSLKNFKEMVSLYATRPGADFQTRLDEPDLPLRIIRRVCDSESNFLDQQREMSYRRKLELFKGKKVLSKEITDSSHNPPKILSTTVQLWPFLKWVFLALDRKYDWCLQVCQDDGVESSQGKLANIINSIRLPQIQQNTSPEDFLYGPSELAFPTPMETVDTIRLTSSVLIPFRDSPFVMEISKVHEWKDTDSKRSPVTWTTMGLNGIHWPEELNYTCAQDLKKNWGQYHENIWRGSAQDPEGQFREFICFILGILAIIS